jgi:hypothetical protein
MTKHTCKSGRVYLIDGDIASPCFNGAGFQIQFGSLADLEDADYELKWDNMTGQYN